MNIPLINILAKQRLEQERQKEALQKQLLRSRLSGEGQRRGSVLQEGQRRERELYQVHLRDAPAPAAEYGSPCGMVRIVPVLGVRTDPWRGWG